MPITEINYSVNLIESIKPSEPYLCKCGKLLEAKQTAYLNADKELFCKECLSENKDSLFKPAYPVYLEQIQNTDKNPSDESVICELKPCFTREIYNIMPDGIYILGYTEDFTDVYIKTSLLLHDDSLDNIWTLYTENCAYLNTILSRNNIGSVIVLKSSNDIAVFFCDSSKTRMHINVFLAMYILDIVYSGREWENKAYAVSYSFNKELFYGFMSSGESSCINVFIEMLKKKTSCATQYKNYFFPKRRTDTPLQDSLRESLKNISSKKMLDYFNERLIGQEEAIKKIVFQFYEYFLSLAGLKPFSAPAWLITAPSGCGKTEIYRILKSFCAEYSLPVPVVNIDLTIFTETGFRGRNIEEIGDMIQNQFKNCDGAAICFLDEADKKCIPRMASGDENVNENFQHDILGFIEGTILHTREGTYDTNKTMFVLLGSFQTIRDNKMSQRNWTAKAGFSAKLGEKYTVQTTDDGFYDEVSMDDMIEFGMIEEFAGRLEQIIALKKLSDEEILKVIHQKTKLISKEHFVEIELTPQAEREMVKTAYTTLGIRKLIYTIKLLVENALLEQYYESDFKRNKCKVVIEGIDCAKLEIIEDVFDISEITSKNKKAI